MFGRQQEMTTKTLLPLLYDKEHHQKNARSVGKSACNVIGVVLPGKSVSRQVHDQIISCKSVATTLLW